MSHISLKVIKDDDDLRASPKSGGGYYTRLQQAIMQYDAFRNRQIAAAYEERTSPQGNKAS